VINGEDVDDPYVLKWDTSRKIEKITEEYYQKILDERTVRIPKDLITITSEKDVYTITMEDLFDRYVKPKYPSKRFNEAEITGRGSHKESSMGINYTYDGVKIFYYGRLTHCIDDYDWFVDRSIYVDGVMILEQIKQ
jgi:hypothetical protein